MYAVNEDKSKASMSEPETITLTNENRHTVLELTKIGCVVYYNFYTTQIVGVNNNMIGSVPSGYRPKSDVIVPCAEYTYQWHAGTGTFRILAGGAYGYLVQNSDPQNRSASGCYITEE